MTRVNSVVNLLIASNNPNKIQEIKRQLPPGIHLQSLKELGITEEIPETADSLEGNAWQKADYLYQKRKCDCFADDTGLEIESLDGEPGVYSARYAGAQRDSQDNMNLVLKNLQGKTSRKAQFRTVIALMFNGERYEFEGVVEGEITLDKSGVDGFGYDPIFKPKGYSKTFAEMTVVEKNNISHRGRAVSKLIQFLSNNDK